MSNVAVTDNNDKNTGALEMDNEAIGDESDKV
jgi:hypothetical protein